MHIDAASEIELLGADRSETVAPDVNIPLQTGEGFQGGNLLGAAHNSYRNQYFLTFTVDENSGDLFGCFVPGTVPAAVDPHMAGASPREFELLPAFPNPFNPSTVLSYRLHEPAIVEICVFDLHGRQIRLLADCKQSAGLHQASWDGRDETGQICTSGVYWINVRSGNHSKRQTISLIR